MIDPRHRRFVVVSYGAGNDSTGMLVGMVERGLPPPDVILFADTGGEKPHTYQYIAIFSAWLVAHGYPPITVVQPRNRFGKVVTLEAELLRNNQLPSIAFGFKTCSQRFKARPQDNWLKARPEVQQLWASGQKVIKAIGYNADEPQRAKEYGDAKFENWYPLIEWEWGEAEVEAAILRNGLPLPGKSACFFCPHATREELDHLEVNYPDLKDRALEMEDRARPTLTKVKGLGRRFSWRDYYEGRPTPDVPAARNCGCYDGGRVIPLKVRRPDPRSLVAWALVA